MLTQAARGPECSDSQGGGQRLPQRENCLTGELSPRTWADYKRVCDLLISDLGKQRLVCDLDPQDFSKLRDKAAA
jgi:hypothetical protein